MLHSGGESLAPRDHVMMPLTPEHATTTLARRCGRCSSKQLFRGTMATHPRTELSANTVRQGLWSDMRCCMQESSITNTLLGLATATAYRSPSSERRDARERLMRRQLHAPVCSHDSAGYPFLTLFVIRLSILIVFDTHRLNYPHAYCHTGFCGPV